MGPMLYVVMEGALHTLSQNNILFKYADDTNLLVPSYSDVSLLSEFEHVKQWAADNKMIINITKTKEIVFRRPSVKQFLAPSAVCGIEQVTSVKLLGIIFKNNLSFDEHVTAVLKCCSQRAYILKLPRDQGMPSIHLDTVFHALILSNIRYALCAWGGFFNKDAKRSD